LGLGTLPEDQTTKETERNRLRNGISKVKGDFEFLLQNEEFQREDKEESKKSLPCGPHST